MSFDTRTKRMALMDLDVGSPPMPGGGLSSEDISVLIGLFLFADLGPPPVVADPVEGPTYVRIPRGSTFVRVQSGTTTVSFFH